MDKIDIEILEFLQSNAKLSAKELADKLSLTSTPIYHRIKKLEKSGVIKGYVTLLDPKKLNRSLTVFISLSMKDHLKENRDKLVSEIEKMDDVVEFYQTSGIYDFLLKVQFADVEEYKNFLVDKVASLYNVGDINSQIVLESIKSSTRVNLKPKKTPD